MDGYSGTTSSVKRGCVTCRTKKVKCDRQHPSCLRCQRLRLTCSWPSPKSLKERRRGHGTLRAREGTNWSPPQILPSGSQSPYSNIQIPSTVCPVQNKHVPVRNVVADTADCERQTAINPMGYADTQSAGQHSPRFISSITTPLCNNPTNYDAFLPNSLVLTDGEQGALADYQKGFLLVRATKRSTWCFHTILLRQGSRSPMVMHLLLAAALQEMSNLRPDDSDLDRAAQANFSAGAQILAKSANCNGFEEHLNFMTSLYFTYMYMAAQRRTDQRRTKELSKAVRDHVKKYKLLDFGGSIYSSSSLTHMSDKHRSLMAYLIMNLQDEDVLCAFQDGGGDLTSYLVSDENLQDVYLTSMPVLQNYWELDYPANEIMDDAENKVILEMRFALNMLLHKINTFSKMIDLEVKSLKEAEIEKEMVEFERSFTMIFRLTAAPGDCNTRLIHGSNMLVTQFHTLRIYFFRCQVGCLDIERPPKVQEAISTVLLIAHRALKIAVASMYPRYSWALFMVGIECKDPIHRDWCVSRIADARIRKALERVIDVQDALMGRLSMDSVRQEISREPF